MQQRVINIDKEIMGGTPVFYGTRVPIKNLFDYLETGDSIEVFLEDFEGVSREQVIKVLEMSKQLVESSNPLPQASQQPLSIAGNLYYNRIKNEFNGFRPWGSNNEPPLDNYTHHGINHLIKIFF